MLTRWVLIVLLIATQGFAARLDDEGPITWYRFNQIMKRAEGYRANEHWLELIQLIHASLLEQPDQIPIVDEVDRHIVPKEYNGETTHVMAIKWLAQLPPKAHEIYEFHYGKLAEVERTKALAEGDTVALRGLALRYPLSRAGRLAREDALLLERERGELMNAAFGLIEEEKDPNFGQKLQLRTLLAGIDVFSRVGMPENRHLWLEKAKARAPAELTIGGRKFSRQDLDSAFPQNFDLTKRDVAALAKNLSARNKIPFGDIHQMIEPPVQCVDLPESATHLFFKPPMTLRMIDKQGGINDWNLMSNTMQKQKFSVTGGRPVGQKGHYAVLNPESGIEILDFSDKGKTVARLPLQFGKGDLELRSVELSPDLSKAVYLDGGDVVVRDLKKDEEITRLEAGATKRPYAVHFGPGGQSLLIGFKSKGKESLASYTIADGKKTEINLPEGSPHPLKGTLRVLDDGLLVSNGSQVTLLDWPSLNIKWRGKPAFEPEAQVTILPKTGRIGDNRFAESVVVRSSGNVMRTILVYSTAGKIELLGKLNAGSRYNEDNRTLAMFPINGLMAGVRASWELKKEEANKGSLGVVQRSTEKEELCLWYVGVDEDTNLKKHLEPQPEAEHK